MLKTCATGYWIVPRPRTFEAEERPPAEPRRFELVEEKEKPVRQFELVEEELGEKPVRHFELEAEELVGEKKRSSPDADSVLRSRSEKADAKPSEPAKDTTKLLPEKAAIVSEGDRNYRAGRSVDNCTFFVKGWCKNGAKCRWRHEEARAARREPSRNKRGDSRNKRGDSSRGRGGRARQRSASRSRGPRRGRRPRSSSSSSDHSRRVGARVVDNNRAGDPPPRGGDRSVHLRGDRSVEVPRRGTGTAGVDSSSAVTTTSKRVDSTIKSSGEGAAARGMSTNGYLGNTRAGENNARAGEDAANGPKEEARLRTRAEIDSSIGAPASRGPDGDRLDGVAKGEPRVVVPQNSPPDSNEDKRLIRIEMKQVVGSSSPPRPTPSAASPLRTGEQDVDMAALRSIEREAVAVAVATKLPSATVSTATTAAPPPNVATTAVSTTSTAAKPVSRLWPEPPQQPPQQPPCVPQQPPQQPQQAWQVSWQQQPSYPQQTTQQTPQWSAEASASQWTWGPPNAPSQMMWPAGTSTGSAAVSTMQWTTGSTSSDYSNQWAPAAPTTSSALGEDADAEVRNSRPMQTLLLEAKRLVPPDEANVAEPGHVTRDKLVHGVEDADDNTAYVFCPFQVAQIEVCSDFADRGYCTRGTKVCRRLHRSRPWLRCRGRLWEIIPRDKAIPP